MAWRQSPGGSEQYLTRAAAAARTRTQRPGKHLAVHASELVVKPDFQILRRYRRPLLLRLEHTHRPTLEDYVHRATRLGSSRSLNLRIGIRARADKTYDPTRRPVGLYGFHPHRLVEKRAGQGLTHDQGGPSVRHAVPLRSISVFDGNLSEGRFHLARRRMSET